MRDLRTLGPWLRRFLADYIVIERHLAANTQKSYRDSFKLLLPFVSTKVHKPVDRLDVEDLTPSRVLQFLAHLEEERDCSVQTRNQRLTAIRSFARFVASRDPVHLAWCAQIRAITTKKATPQPVSWMTKDEMEALLAVPDRQTPQGRAEHALLLFLYNTGARVSEATRLEVGNLQIGQHGGNHALVTLCGKRDKSANAHCGHARRTRFANSVRGARTMTRSSSVAIAGATPGSGSIGSSNDVRPACQPWPQGRSHRTSCVTQAPVICCRLVSISTPFARGSGMSASIPPTFTLKSISK